MERLAGPTSITTSGLVIDASYQGGKVAYLDASGQHGLIAADADQTPATSGIRWYNGTYTLMGATGTAIGTGSANTTAIIASQGEVATSYAAGLARAYDGGGYGDWYLPSKDELNQLYLNREAIGGFRDAYYWSSSESEANANVAWHQYFGTGAQQTYYKGDRGRVRAVRTF